MKKMKLFFIAIVLVVFASGCGEQLTKKKAGSTQSVFGVYATKEGAVDTSSPQDPVLKVTMSLVENDVASVGLPQCDVSEYISRIPTGINLRNDKTVELVISRDVNGQKTTCYFEGQVVTGTQMVFEDGTELNYVISKGSAGVSIYLQGYLTFVN